MFTTRTPVGRFMIKSMTIMLYFVRACTFVVEINNTAVCALLMLQR